MNVLDNVILKFFEYQISFRTTGEIVDKIRQEHKKIKEKTYRIPPKEVSKAAKAIRNEICDCIHPLVKKMLDWGYLKGRTEYGRMLEGVIEDLLIKNIESSAEVKMLERKIEEFKEGILKDICKIVKGLGGDLRPLHAPGSVSRNEARNLYFREVYNKQALSQLGTWLLSSICVGKSFAVFFKNETLRDEMSTELLRNFKAFHILSRHLRKLCIHPLEMNKPYLVFLKFLLWIYERYETESEADAKGRLHRILNLLKETEGIIYFAPGKDKAKYSTIPLPRLDFFLSNWLEVEKRKNALKRARDSLYYFMQDVIRSAAKKKERKLAQDKLELLATYYDMFCTELLRSGFISYESLRRIINLVVELSDRYKDIYVNLSFFKELTLAEEYGRNF